MLTISLPKVEGTFEVNDDAFPEEIRQKLFAYGVQQKLHDACAGLKLADFGGEAELRAAIEARLAEVMEALVAGRWREGGGGRTLDPVEAECRATAEASLRKAGMKAADAKKEAVDWRSLVRRGAEARAAKANLDEAAREAAVEKAVKAFADAARKRVKARAEMAVDLDF